MSGVQRYEGLYIKYDGSINLPFEEITEKWDSPEEFIKDLKEGRRGLYEYAKILTIATGNQSAINTENVPFTMRDYKEMCDKDAVFYYRLTAQDIRDYLEGKGISGADMVYSVEEESAKEKT